MQHAGLCRQTGRQSVRARETCGLKDAADKSGRKQVFSLWHVNAMDCCRMHPDRFLDPRLLPAPALSPTASLPGCTGWTSLCNLGENGDGTAHLWRPASSPLGPSIMGHEIGGGHPAVSTTVLQKHD